MTGRDLGDGPAQNIDVVPGVVAAGVARPQRDRQQLGRVIAPHAERMEPEAALERRRGLLLLRVRGHQRGVHIQHHHLAEIGAGDLRRRHAGQQIPDVPADPRPGLLDPLQRRRGGLIQGPPHRRRRRDRAEQPGLVAQGLDVGDRLTPAVSIIATSTQTWPRSWPGVNPRRANAVDKPSVSPTRSASSRTATAPASGTTPSPSAVTDNPCDHEVRFTCEVLLSLAERDLRQASFSQARSTFQLINTVSTSYPMNGEHLSVFR